MANKDKEFVLYDRWSDYPGVGRVTDRQVAKYARKRLKFWDRFNPTKVALAALTAQDILFKVLDKDDLPKNPNWKFSFPNESKKKGR